MPSLVSRHPAACLVVWALVLRAPYALHEMYDVDEGSYAAVAAAIVDGDTEYRDAMGLKFPGIYWTYAGLFRLFGNYDMHAVHVAAILVTAATAWILFAWARTLAGDAAGLWASFFYVSLTTIFPANLAANCELFMNLPCAFGAYALWRSGANRNSHGWAFAAGAAAAAAMIYKQNGAVIGVVGALHYLVLWRFRQCSLRRIATLSFTFVTGFAIPVAAMLAYFYWRDCLDDFVFWTLTYVRRYLSFGSRRLNYVPSFVILFLPFVVLYGSAWLPAIAWIRKHGAAFLVAWSKRLPADDPQAVRSLLITWLLFSVAVTLTSPRMYPHYWLQFLPPLSLIAGLGVAEWSDASNAPRRRRIGWAVVLPSLGSWLWAWAYVGATPPALFAPNPDYRPAVEYVRSTTPPEARVFVWGWFTPLYVETERTPGTRFVTTQMFVTYRPEFAARDQGYWLLDRFVAWIEVPEAWEMLEEDFSRRPPDLILDTSPGNLNHFGLFPMGDFPHLARIVAEKYQHEKTIGGVGVYRRKATNHGAAANETDAPD